MKITETNLLHLLPTEKWGFHKFGKVKSGSIKDNYEKEWEKFTGIWDYDPDTFGLSKTINSISDIIKDSSGNYNRNNGYKFICHCHGDGSETFLTNVTVIDVEPFQKNEIPENAKPYCIIEKYKKIIVDKFAVCQTPMYLMQLLAAYMSGQLKTGDGKGLWDENSIFVLDLNIADRYEKAKKGILLSGIGGLEHPHYLETYYILSKNI